MSSYPGCIDSPFWDDLLDDDISIARSKAYKRLVANARRNSIVQILSARFPTSPESLNQALATVTDPTQLSELVTWSAICGSLQEFHAKLSVPQ
jgi:hypothetical protein